MTPTEIELHLSASPEFTRKHGSKVRLAGGRYSECRGNSGTRFVHLPWADDTRELANTLIREYGRRNYKTTVIFRGKCESFRDSHVHATIVVQYASKDSSDPIGECFASFQKAFAEAHPAALVPAVFADRFRVCRFSFSDNVEVRKATVDLASLDPKGRVWCDEGPCRGWLTLADLFESESEAWEAVADDFERQREFLILRIADAREAARRAAKRPA